MSTAVADGTYVGTTTARRRFAGLTLAETTYTPRLDVPAHVHASGLVVLMLEGAMTEHRGRRAIACEAGSMIFQPPDEAHAHRFGEKGGRCFLVQLGEPWVQRMSSLELARPRSPLALRGGRGVQLIEGLRREFDIGDAASELAIEGHALSLLEELARARERTERSAKPGWLLRAVDILHERSSEPLRMADIALEVGVHPVHLSRTFSLRYGCTMGEYLRRLRVEAARSELAGSGKPLSTIAFEAGFCDQAHFTRVFKELVGVTPGAYRAMVGDA